MPWRRGHWLWSHTHLVFILAQLLMSSSAPENKDKAHKGLVPGAERTQGFVSPRGLEALFSAPGEATGGSRQGCDL